MRVARAAPDGYTWLFCGAGVVVTVPEMVKTSYSRSNFAPIGLVNKSSMVLLARNNDTRFRNFKELAAYARFRGGQADRRALRAGHAQPPCAAATRVPAQDPILFG